MEPSPAPAPQPQPPTPPDKPNYSLLTALVYIMLLVAGVGGVYLILNQQLTSLKQQVTATQSQLTAQQADVSNTIDSTKYQGVFLSSGQAYFGKLSLLGSQNVKLTDVYYFQSGTTGTSVQQQSGASSGNVSLVKLGCELHMPSDQMIINRSRIDFWENLQDSGRAVRAIQAFQKQNPNGQHCQTQ